MSDLSNVDQVEARILADVRVLAGFARRIDGQAAEELRLTRAALDGAERDVEHLRARLDVLERENVTLRGRIEQATLSSAGFAPSLAAELARDAVDLAIAKDAYDRAEAAYQSKRAK